MTIDELMKICKKFPGTTSDIKWEDHLCFNVGEKMYLITSPDTVPVSASFKADENQFEELVSREGFIPAPYLARYKWVYVDDIKRMTKKEWEEILAMSYRLVSHKLPGKLKKQLKLKE